MHSPKFQTFSVKNQSTQFEFYILCKGLNSGKPLDKPCPNSYVSFGLWKAKHFHQLLTGSVIPFIRIDEFKKEVATQAEHVSKQRTAYAKTIDKIKLLEQKEKQLQQYLAVIQDVKRATIYRYLKR